MSSANNESGPSVIRAAPKVKNIRYAVRDVAVLANELKRAGKRMLWLNIGDPNPYGWKPPEHIVEPVFQAMRDNLNGYAPSDGIEEAVDAIRRDATRRGIGPICHAWVGNGVSEVIDMAMTALLDRGENVLTPSPGYPLYTALLSKLEAENRPYHLHEDRGWQPDLEEMEAAIDAKTRAIVVINPNNPTGSVASEETLRGIVALAEKHGLLVIADEIYDRLLFDGRQHIPMGSLSETAPVLSLGGLSKNWLVPGWRVGWGVLTGEEGMLSELREGIQQLGRARLSANHPEQAAILPALEGSMEHIEKINEEMKVRATLAVERLNASERISCVMPEGAFYAFPQLHIDESDNSFCADLMRATGVVVVPGSGFGQKEGTAHFRVVLLPRRDEIVEACDAIATFADAR